MISTSRLSGGALAGQQDPKDCGAHPGTVSSRHHGSLRSSFPAVLTASTTPDSPHPNLHPHCPSMDESTEMVVGPHDVSTSVSLTDVTDSSLSGCLTDNVEQSAHSSSSSRSSTSSDDSDDDPELDELPAMCGQLLTSKRAAASDAYTRDNGLSWAERLVRTEEGFKRRIRMSLATFEHLYGHVRPYLRRPGDGRVGRPPTVAPRVRLLLTLFWLAHGGSQFVACDVADVAKSTFSAILCEVLSAIAKGLPPVCFPMSCSEQESNAADFVEQLGSRIAGVVAVLDGTLIPIRTPPAAWRLAFNTRKCFYGVLLLGMVDTRKRFLWVRTGLRGSLGDSRAFKESEWYDRQSTPGRHVLHPGRVVLADGGFALEYWLLKPFPLDEITTPKRRFYNICLTSTRAIVECAFGLLKGWWRVLRYVSAETELVPSIVEACVLLHNFLIDVGEELEGLANGSGGGSGDVHPDVGVTAAYDQALHLRDQVVDLLWQTHA